MLKGRNNVQTWTTQGSPAQLTKPTQSTEQERCTSCMCPLSHSTAQRPPEASFWFSDVSLHMMDKISSWEEHKRGTISFFFFAFGKGKAQPFPKEYMALCVPMIYSAQALYKKEGKKNNLKITKEFCKFRRSPVLSSALSNSKLWLYDAKWSQHQRNSLG